MRPSWIVVDCHSLAYRAFHSMGGLSFRGTPTGVLYGFLGAVLQFQNQFGTDNVVFCFDKGRPKRKKISKAYKANRTKSKWGSLTEEQKQAYQDVQNQIEGLRTNYLTRIGFKNVYYQHGYEADDLIASVCDTLDRRKQKSTIITGDKDMLQCLSKYTQIYFPTKKEVWTRKRFREHYGLIPEQWIHVKAMAGCSSDEIAGIPGIGEVTAVKYLKEELKPSHKSYNKILEGRKLVKENFRLVQLPLEGTKQFNPQLDTKLDWKEVLDELGIRSLNPGLKYKERPKDGKRSKLRKMEMDRGV